mgnify:CR=1 FL=1|jgi:hypothetical protein
MGERNTTHYPGDQQSVVSGHPSGRSSQLVRLAGRR